MERERERRTEGEGEEKSKEDGRRQWQKAKTQMVTPFGPRKVGARTRARSRARGGHDEHRGKREFGTPHIELDPPCWHPPYPIVGMGPAGITT